MTVRLKMLSAASAIAMTMAVGGVQAAELLTADQLDAVTAGGTATAEGLASASAFSANNNDATAFVAVATVATENGNDHLATAAAASFSQADP